MNYRIVHLLVLPEF